MDELTKYRITGAVIWLALLIILVPSWYANPVDYEKAQPWLYSTPDDSVSPTAKMDNQFKKSTSNKLDDSSAIRSNKKSESEVTPSLGRDIQTNVSSPTAPSQPTQAKQSIESKKQQDANTEILDKSTATAKSQDIKEPVLPSEDKSPAWLVRVASYNSIESANKTLGVLEMRYTVTIGDFSTKTQKIYTVRVGPFPSLQEAEEAKAELDKELVTNSAIVQIR
ncbi:MAG: SPOR domain-containing protein [Thiomicrospira sp.]|uniref:SPOR domain-containing protein n=1 Tax=Thiomicrospira sp. TaxID=935 RepID=UPI0019F64497|nr:SPOR domain-containing protein [Thiomicrospira sp.]MBE0493409.1 SPOR domain-containing protein [Thiomicrospira sp.]